MYLSLFDRIGRNPAFRSKSKAHPCSNHICLLIRKPGAPCQSYQQMEPGFLNTCACRKRCSLTVSLTYAGKEIYSSNVFRNTIVYRCHLDQGRRPRGEISSPVHVREPNRNTYTCNVLSCVQKMLFLNCYPNLYYQGDFSTRQQSCLGRNDKWRQRTNNC